MEIIWKEQLLIASYQEVVLPIGSKILTVQVQDYAPCIWFMKDVDTKNTEVRKFVMVGTGHVFKEEKNLEYIGTFQTGGGYVFHLFETKGD